MLAIFFGKERNNYEGETFEKLAIAIQIWAHIDFGYSIILRSWNSFLFTELYFHFVSVVRLSILEKQVKSGSSGLDPLLVLEHHIAQSEHLGVLGNALLHPALGELRMTL